MLSLLILSISCFVALLVALAALLTVAQRLLLSYGLCRIDINAKERELEVEGGETLVTVLNESEIFIPSACGGRGTCGYCKLTVVSGAGPVLPTETPFLTRVERITGVRLACQVKVRQDMELRIPEELLNVRLYSATVTSTRDLTYDIKEIRLVLLGDEEIPHRPGQYVQVQAPSPEGFVWRAYSISSPTYEPTQVELIVRLVPGGVASTYLFSLNAGDPILFTGPYGDFRLNEDPEVEVICVGGGCGMAPIKNIVYTLCHRWPDRSCKFFFGCRTTRDIFYLDQFHTLARKHPNFQVVYALSDRLKPDEQWDGETSFIHLSVDKYLEAGVRRQAFLCGPPPMIEAVKHVLEQKGLTEKDIFYDEF